MRRLFCLLLILPALAAGLSAAGIHGYFKSFALTLMLPDSLAIRDTNPPLGLVTNRLRMTFSTSVSASVSVEAAWDLSPGYSGSIPEGYFPSTMKADSPQDYRAVDFKPRLSPPSGDPAENFSLSHNLDRLLVTIRFPGADLYIGRQAIAWGSGRMVNPTDLITPFTFNELDTEDRRGVDAIRLRVPLGMMDELDLGWVAGRHFALDRSAFFLRGKFHLGGTDMALLAMAFRRHFLVGLDMAGSIGGAGAWLEAAWVKPFAFRSSEPGDHNAYFRLSTGMDYKFSGIVYAFGEYHFNSAGSGNPATYASLADTAAFRDGSVYLMGRHYITLGSTIQATPLLPVSLMVIWNLDDGSLTMAPSAEYNVAENVYLVLGAYFAFGETPATDAAGLLPRSEFGTWPHMLYTAFRYYF